jgi:Derlin-2/3
MSGNQNGGEAAARGLDDFDFKSFVNDIPPVTRTLLLSTVFCTLGSGFGLLPSYAFGLSWPAIVGRFHFWRLVTSFLHLGRLGFPFLINCYFLFHYSKQLENGFFLGRTANYCWMLTIVAGITLVASLVLPIYAAGPALLMAIMHLWGRHSPTLTVKMYGILAIPAKYLSLAMIGLDLILGGGIDATAVVGLVAGHAYYFLDSVYPTMPNGMQLISTPPAFERLVDQVCVALASATGLGAVQPPAPPSQARRHGPGGTSTVGSIRSAGSSSAAATGARAGITMPSLRAAAGGYNWGSGQTLGSN